MEIKKHVPVASIYTAHLSTDHREVLNYTYLCFTNTIHEFEFFMQAISN